MLIPGHKNYLQALQEQSGFVSETLLQKPQIKTLWLEYFVETVRYGNVKSAAQALNISTNAVQRCLSQLEACPLCQDSCRVT